MELVTAIAAWMLAIAAALSVYRMIKGPGVADRMVALDTLLFIGVGGLGIAIVTTSSGVLSDRKCRELKVGGEIVAIVT